jgi:thiol-disulfide isomerase/thioredoxin
MNCCGPRVRTAARGRGARTPVRLPVMRPVIILVLVLVLLVSIAAFAAPPAPANADEIRWIRADGSAGWTTAISRETRPAGVVAVPLTAPTWFARIPDAKVPIAGSGTFDLASARGKVLLIDYWASWCGPCLLELPHLQKLFATRGSKGLVALAINVDEDAPTAAASAKKLGLTMTIGLNEPALYRALNARSLPTLILVDREGRVRERWNGYRVGVETEIAAKVDALLAGDSADAGRPIAGILAGAGKITARWYRDLPGTADGVVGLPADEHGKATAVASAGGMLISFRADGETSGQLKGGSTGGRLLDFGIAADGSREIAGYREGAAAVSIRGIPSGAERQIAVPAPIVDAAVEAQAGAEHRHVAVVTMGGAMLAGANDAQATPLDGAGAVRAVASRPGRGVLALRADGSISFLDAAAVAWPAKAEGAERLLAARAEGAAVGPRTVVASAYGRFLPGTGAQLAVATYAGHLVLLDAADGRVLFDAVWADLHGLSAVDLDGDGLDELLVAAGHSVAALGASPRAPR